MQTIRLFTPGPTPVFPGALEIFAKPILHHRTEAFMSVMEAVRAGLKYVFGTQQEVLILAASGTGAMEGTVVNLFNPGDKVIVVRGGKFGERWGEIAEAYGITVIPLDIPWGTAPTVRYIQNGCEKHPEAKAVLLQACETSTAADYPIKDIAAFTRTTDKLLVVDAISYLGVSEYEMDAWGVDVTVSGSQKGFMLPPGLAFVAFNERAWKAAEKSTLPKFYFHFPIELKSIQKNQTAYTPAVSLIMGLQAVLDYFKKEKKETIYAQYKKFSNAMRMATEALHLELFPQAPSHGLIAIKVPENLEGKKIVAKLRDEHRMLIAGGQGHLTGKIVRISCIGHTDPFNLISVFSALEDVLKSLGANIEYGKGVSRLEKALLGK